MVNGSPVLGSGYSAQVVLDLCDPGARRTSSEVTLASSLPVCPLCGPVSDAGSRSCCSLISVIGINLSEETSLVKSSHRIAFLFPGLSNIDLYSVFCLHVFVFAKTQSSLQCIFFNLAFHLKLHLVIFSHEDTGI